MVSNACARDTYLVSLSAQSSAAAPLHSPSRTALQRTEMQQMATVVKRPSGKWQATVRSGGASRSKSFTMRTDAVRWSRETELQAERGELHDTRAPVATAISLGQILERFRDQVTPTRAHADVERWRIDAMRRTKLAWTTLDKLTAADVAKHRDARLKKVKPGTVVRELSLLQSAIDLACDEWHQAKHLPNGNPLRQVGRTRVDDRRERRLRPGEWQQLLDAIDDRRSPLMRPLVVLALETGMRRGELLSLQWKNVDLDRRTALLPKTKNGHARTVPLSPLAAETLAKLQRTDTRGSVLKSVYLARPMRFQILKRRSARRTLWRTDCGLQTIPGRFGHPFRTCGLPGRSAWSRPRRSGRNPAS
ncbi:site-specific integrase [Pukyongiella litopenaei]|uniref:Site-specific integrase n=1 Tax=Pukyongiella litopenaei TaxID=2605946 RepID=A0A2S0MMM8_9RHOB|nr:site-specific integrase [Pukyongiella litopenaei]